MWKIRAKFQWRSYVNITDSKRVFTETHPYSVALFSDHLNPTSINLTKVKVKCNLVQALKLCTGRTAHRKSRGIALLFLDHGTRRGEGSASRLGRS